MRVSPGAPGNFATGGGTTDVNLIKVGGTAISLGQTTMTASIPVVLASDQSALPVSVSGTVTVSGTVAATQSGSWSVTANAGTNLNTSTLALESGGNLASLAAEDFATQTTLAAINTKLVTGTDIGDVTINNSTGASAVNIQDGGNSITVDAPVGTPVFVRLSDGASAISTLPVSLASVPSHDVTNAGTFAVQAAQSGTWNITNISGTVSLPTGAATAANQLADGHNVTIDNSTGASAVNIQDGGNTITVDGTVTANLAAGTNKVGDVDIAPRTTGGWSVGNFTSGDTYTALTNSAQVIKGSAGKFGGYYIYNPNSSATYVLVYNIAAASVTVGTSTAKLVFCIPASSGANLEILAGIPFDTAMSIAAATTGGGNSAPATALECMVLYV